MSVPYEVGGRSRQKSRTRRELVDACRELLAEGLTPRVEDAAERAGVARTTAYRYFPNQRSLLVAAQPNIQPDTLLDDNAPTEIRSRLDAFMAAFTAYNVEWEPQLRAAMRLSLEPAASGSEHGGEDGSEDSGPPVLRGGRAIGWVEHSLAPLRHSHPHIDIHELAVAIRSATGIESLIWLRDVAGQTPEAAARTVRHTARALLDAALASTRP